MRQKSHSELNKVNIKLQMCATKKWFDKECRLKRHSVRKLANQKHIDPSNSEIRKKYHETLKIYKDTLKHKKELFHKKELPKMTQTHSG